jgi:hypothetical protein
MLDVAQRLVKRRVRELIMTGGAACPPRLTAHRPARRTRRSTVWVRHGVQDGCDGQGHHRVLSRSDLHAVGVGDPEHFFDTSATLVQPSPIVYSWSTTLPLTSRSGPPATYTVQRSRSGVIGAFLTTATLVPARSSISIVSRTRSMRSSIFTSSAPRASSKMRVWRSRRALPSTL